MLIDAPGFEETDLKKGDTQIRLTDENAGEGLDMINRLNR
jgi:hypothetical protein